MRTRGSYDLPEVRSLVAAFREVRESRGMSQKELAMLMDASQAWVCDIELGRHPDPQVSTLVRLATGLDVRAMVVIEDEQTRTTWKIPIGTRGGGRGKAGR